MRKKMQIRPAMIVAVIVLAAVPGVLPAQGPSDVRPMVNMGHKESIFACAFSPDGRYLATGSADETIKIWDVQTARLIDTFAGLGTVIGNISFSHDGRLLAAGAGLTLNVWDFHTRAKMHSLRHEYQGMGPVSFGPDDTLVAGGGSSFTIWNARTGKLLRTFNSVTTAGYGLTSISMSRDGKTIVSTGYDKILRVWGAHTGAMRKEIKGHEKEITIVAINPDGKSVASAGYDNTIKIWNIESGALLRTLKDHDVPVMNLSFSADGLLLLSIDYNRSLKLWMPKSGELVKTIKLGKYYSGYAGAISPDGKLIVSSGWETTGTGKSYFEGSKIKFWEAESGDLLREIVMMKGGKSDVLCASLNQEEGLLGAVTEGGERLKLWDTAAGVPAGVVPSIRYFRFHPDGKSLACFDGHQLKFVDAAAGRELSTFRNSHRMPSPEMVFYSARERKIISSYRNSNEILISSMDTEEVLSNINTDPLRVHSLVMSADGSLIVAGGQTENVAHLYDVKSGKLVKAITATLKNLKKQEDFKGHIGSVWSVAISPDKSILATGSDDKNVKLWNAGTGALLHTLKGHTKTVWSLLFSPDGRLLASTGDDIDILLWDARTGRPAGTLKGHTHSVKSLYFTRNGRYLISGSGDSSIRLWDLASKRCVLSLFSLSESDWVAVTPDGRYDGTPAGIERIHFVVDNEVVLLKDFDKSFFQKGLLAGFFKPLKGAAAIASDTRGVLIGKIYSSGAGEIVVASGRAAELLRMGARVFVVVDGKKVQLQVIFPMMTTARCRLLDAAYAAQLKAGMPVFK